MRPIAIGLAAVLVAGPAAAQPVYSIGVLTPHMEDPNYAAFPRALRELGYQEGKNLTLMVRSAERKYDRLPGLAGELVKARANVIVAVNTPGARAAIRATRDVPIVMVNVGDPLGSGFVSNLGRPGGNVTGVSNMTGALAAKRMSLMKELVPATKRIAVLYNPVDPVTAPQIRDSEQAAPRLGIEVRFYPVKAVHDLPEVFRQMLAWGANAGFWLSGQGNIFQVGTAELSIRHRLPVMVSQRVDVEAGGLISYFPDHAELYRRAALYVDRILKGAKPGELAVELPTKFELAVNLKTASAMGLAIPGSLLLQADHVVK
jgi:putative tryptophan/tyrosine transport system substrate-binding protein